MKSKIPQSDIEAKWRIYNHALISKNEPHENISTDDYKLIDLKSDVCKKAILVQYTTDFDSTIYSDWWYVIKDSAYDLSSLNSKRRYEIKKGRKNFEIRKINPSNHTDDLLKVLDKACQSYFYGTRINRQKQLDYLLSGKGSCFAAFYRGSKKDIFGQLCGVAYLIEGNRCINYSSHKVDPDFEKYSINAALVDGILSYYDVDIANGKYVCDGARTILHKTSFQDYLEKYFGFRKAYCKLNIMYNPRIKWLIPLLYAFKGLFSHLDFIERIYQLNGVLKMEEIIRHQNKMEHIYTNGTK